jgi:hypothetical protein
MGFKCTDTEYTYFMPATVLKFAENFNFRIMKVCIDSPVVAGTVLLFLNIFEANKLCNTRCKTVFIFVSESTGLFIRAVLGECNIIPYSDCSHLAIGLQLALLLNY